MLKGLKTVTISLQDGSKTSYVKGTTDSDNNKALDRRQSKRQQMLKMLRCSVTMGVTRMLRCTG